MFQNAHGADECSTDVTVAVKPKFTQRFNDVDLFRGEKAEFVCDVTGSPSPDVTWFHEKLALTVSIWVITYVQAVDISRMSIN